MKTALKKSALFRHPGKKAAEQTGIARLTLLIFVPIVLATIYTANQVAPFYYNYFELRNQMRSLIEVASVHTDEELLKKLEKHMKWMEIPASVEDVRMRRFSDSMEISLEYEETFWFTWDGEDYEIYTFEFSAIEEGNF
jgi:hypothetical protein